MRTTLDLEKTVLQRLKTLQAKEKVSLGRIASSLLAEAMAAREQASGVSPSARLEWTCAPLGARVDVEDKDALWRILDGPSRAT